MCATSKLSAGVRSDGRQGRLFSASHSFFDTVNGTCLPRRGASVAAQVSASPSTLPSAVCSSTWGTPTPPVQSMLRSGT